MAVILSKKQIKEGWQSIRFDEIARNISERVEPGETDLEVYIGLEHLDPGSLRLTRRGVPSDVEGQKLRVRPGQIIFGKRRAYQRKVAVADFDGICSAHAMVLAEITGKIIPGLLPFFMQSDMFMERAVSISEGSLSPTIKWKTLAAQEFPLPPVERQRGILEVLEKVEECDNINRSITASLDSIFRRLSKSSYIDPCVSAFSKRNLSYFIDGIESGKSVLSSGRKSNEAEIGVLKVSAVNNGEFIPTENKFVDDPNEVAKLSCSPEKDDWLVTRANTPELVGDICWVTESNANIYLPDKIWKLKKNTQVKFDFDWLFFYLLALRVFGKTGEIASGTSGSMKNISQEKYLSLCIYDPGYTMQVKIGKALRLIYDMKAVLCKQYDKSKIMSKTVSRLFETN